MKKKVIIISIIIITTIISIVVAWRISIFNKEKEANRLYGNEYCEENGKHAPYYSGYPGEIPMAEYKECPICKHHDIFTYEAMCDNCAKKLHRCVTCGKKLK